MRVMTKNPRNLSPWEIPIHLNLKLKLPELTEIKAEGEIEIPAIKAKEIKIRLFDENL